MKMKIGILGAGNMGRNHIRVVKDLVDSYDLIGFFEPNNEVAKNVIEQFNIKRYQSVDELIDMVDAIDIVVPSSLHYEMALKVANKNKHCFVEKPLTLNVDEAEELNKKFMNLNKILMVGHVERFNPTVDELNKVLANEKIISIDIHRCSPFDGRITDADVIQDLMIHDIDILVNSLVHSDMSKMFATGSIIHNKDKVDIVQALFHFKNGINASIMASRVTEEKIRTIEVHTMNAYVFADLLNRKIQISRKTNCRLDVGFAPLYRQENIIERIYIPAVEPLKSELLHFNDSVTNNIVPKTCARDAINALQVAKKVGELVYE